MPSARKEVASGARLRSSTLPLSSSLPMSSAAAVWVMARSAGMLVSTSTPRPSVGIDLPDHRLALHVHAQELFDPALRAIEDVLRVLGERHALLEQRDRFLERLIPFLEALDDGPQPLDGALEADRSER